MIQINKWELLRSKKDRQYMRYRVSKNTRFEIWVEEDEDRVPVYAVRRIATRRKPSARRAELKSFDCLDEAVKYVQECAAEYAPTDYAAIAEKKAKKYEYMREYCKAHGIQQEGAQAQEQN